MYLIAGLGNPGNKYKGTKHNVGFETIDYLSDKYNTKINKIKFKSIFGEVNIDGQKVILMKPQTFMNNSGEAIREAKEYYKIPIENIIVIQDDIDLDLGKLRVKRKGSSGSHNGLKSIIYQIQDENFPRVKIGVGRQNPGEDLANYVLTGFKREDIPMMEETIKTAGEAAISIVENGIDKTLNKYNSN